jgi:Subtilase family
MSNGSSERFEGTKRELVVMVNPSVGLRASGTTVASVEDVDVSPLADLVSTENIALFPLFGVNEERLKEQAETIATTAGTEPPDLSVFYKVEAPGNRFEELAERLRSYEVVETAFVKPPSELPQLLNNMVPSMSPAPPSTSDFTSRQLYLQAAPNGIDALYAAGVKGGSGRGVSIIDIEGAWRFSHEDLLENQGGVIAGTPTSMLAWRNHGTAVVGAIGGDRNGFGVTGICPEANVKAISVFPDSPSWGSAPAIRHAANVLERGDIILLELHRAGPRFNFAPRDDQRGYIAIEWWPDDLAAIQYAISRGIIVVEAGGNGRENLDDPIYDANPASPHGPFPSTWRNPFRRAPIDSGAIIVGAGAPPPGTHGSSHGPDRSRLGFSNFGAAFDAQGWGREVTTCGYGDLQGGPSEDLWYTDQFAGTSSASPIVVGTLACVQGILRAAGKPLLTPAQARSLLRSTGSLQQDGPNGNANQRIGNRPNIRQIVEALLGVPVAVNGRNFIQPAADLISEPITIQIPRSAQIRIDVVSS